MATVAPSSPSVNSAVFPLQLAPIAWQALGYIAGKEGDRDALADGALHDIDLTVCGAIDGQPVEQHFAGRLMVGYSSEKASSTTPNLAEIVGCILGKLNPSTRDAICRDLPAEYAAGGQSLPALPVGLAKQAEKLLASLRQTKRVPVRGSVKFEYSLDGADEALPAVAGRIGD